MKIFFIAIVTAFVVFIVKFLLDYNRLVLLQPKNGVLSANFTSFPPSAAWISALPWSLGVFVIVFAIGLIIFRK